MMSKEEGKDVTFNCGATGSPPPEISWLRSSTLLSNSTTIQNGSISYLVLRSVQKEQNSSVYHCEAANLAGRASSKGAILTVTPKMAEIPTVSTFPHDSRFCHVISQPSVYHFSIKVIQTGFCNPLERERGKFLKIIEL